MQNLLRLLGYLRPYVGQLVAAGLMLAVAGGLASLILATLKPLVNDVILGRVEIPTPTVVEVVRDGPVAEVTAKLEDLRQRLLTGPWSQWVRERAFVTVPAVIVVVFLIRGVFLYFGSYITTRVGVTVIRNIRAELYEKIVYQSQRFFRLHTTGSLMSRLFPDVQRIRKAATEVLADLIRVTAMLPFLVLVVVLHEWRISLLSVIGVPLIAYPMVRLGHRLRRASRSSQENMADATSLLTETVLGIKVMQGFAMERLGIQRFRNALDWILRADLKAGRASALSTPLLELVGGVLAAVLFFFAGRAIAGGQLDPGDFTVAMAGLGMIFVSVRRLNRINVELQEALAAAERVFSLLDEPREIRDATGAGTLPPFERRIHFEGVEFGYEREPVLHDIDLEISRGEMVALVGPSGSGKSTIANLLLRFYDPDEGRITIDGVDIRTVKVASLRSFIGLVTQETVLFDESVRFNICCGREDVPLERVMEAARAAHAHEFITDLPDGYETVLGELGSRLSMGQRQRIAIARALLKDPPILILDEATSALDSESELLVQRALDTLLAGRTSLVIAHRLSTVRRADRIVVLDNGRIVEEGRHAVLTSRGGLYARLHDLQFREV